MVDDAGGVGSGVVGSPIADCALVVGQCPQHVAGGGFRGEDLVDGWAIEQPRVQSGESRPITVGIHKHEHDVIEWNPGGRVEFASGVVNVVVGSVECGVAVVIDLFGDQAVESVIGVPASGNSSGDPG